MKPFPLLAVAACLAALPAASQAHDPDRITRGVLHVTASASADVAPDQASVTAGVESEASSAREAMTQNSAQMRRVYEALDKAGVNRRDIATSRLNLSQRYDYDRNTNKRINLRYAASNQVTVKTTDLEGVGGMIDALLAAGLNNIQDVRFYVKDSEAALDKARREAIAKARLKAKDMAEAAGVDLKELLALTEGSSPGPMMEDEIVTTGARAGAFTSSAPPLLPGQRELTATVTMSYAMD